MAGREVCNAYTELNNPVVQRQRFADQVLNFRRPPVNCRVLTPNLYSPFSSQLFPVPPYYQAKQSVDGDDEAQVPTRSPSMHTLHPLRTPFPSPPFIHPLFTIDTRAVCRLFCVHIAMGCWRCRLRLS